MKKALIVATIMGFLNFEKSDIELMKKLGYEVHCAANMKYENDKTKNIDIIRHNIDFSRNPFCKQTIVAYNQLKELLEKEHYDLIHCHTPVGGVIARLAAKKYRKKGVKVIYTAHGFHFFKGAPLRNWLIYYPVEWMLSWITDVIITINTEDYDRAKHHFHALKTKYIPGVGIYYNKYQVKDSNNIELRLRKCTELGIDSNKFILMSAGEHSERKNHIVVIEALNKIKNDDIIYLLVGSGALTEVYREKINEYKLNDSVIMPGYRLDIDELCKSVDCFVHPSIREGLGLAPLEAMASGLPLISADINGIRDYTEQGKTGICVDPRSIDQMVNAINKMYEDCDFRRMCGEYNVKKAKKYDIDNVQTIMEEIYCNI